MARDQALSKVLQEGNPFKEDKAQKVNPYIAMEMAEVEEADRGFQTAQRLEEIPIKAKLERYVSIQSTTPSRPFI